MVRFCESISINPSPAKVATALQHNAFAKL